jgi:hypothetical protein
MRIWTLNTKKSPPEVAAMFAAEPFEGPRAVESLEAELDGRVAYRGTFRVAGSGYVGYFPTKVRKVPRSWPSGGGLVARPSRHSIVRL